MTGSNIGGSIYDILNGDSFEEGFLAGEPLNAASPNRMHNESAEEGDFKVTIDDDGSGAVVIEVETPSGKVTVVTEPTKDGDTLILTGPNGSHVESDGVTLSDWKGAAIAIGREYGATEVVIDPGERTSGANPGRKGPRRAIKVPPE